WCLQRRAPNECPARARRVRYGRMAQVMSTVSAGSLLASIVQTHAREAYFPMYNWSSASEGFVAELGSMSDVTDLRTPSSVVVPDTICVPAGIESSPASF